MITLLHSLLRHGWLPRELPPAFSSASFADVVMKLDLQEGRTKDFPDALAVTHTMPRYEGLRRELSITNPRPQLGLSREIAGSWGDLEGHFARSPFSASRPTLNRSGRAIERLVARPDLGERRALNRGGAGHLLQTDISNFYASIYTHSVPWALHTKDVAKRKRQTQSLLGNRLDLWVRKGQSGQTNGIPVGPDTSLVLAEVVLSAADHNLALRRPTLRALRYMDDYEFALNSPDEGDAIRRELEEELAEYKLLLNREKTRKQDLPTTLQQPWVTHIRRTDVRFGTLFEHSDIIDYFSSAFQHAAAYRGEAVLNFAVAHLRQMPGFHDRATSEVLDALMLQVMITEPGTHRYAIDHFITKGDCSSPSLRGVLIRQITEGVRTGHQNEAAWALWAILAMNLDLGDALVGKIEATESDVVALLCMAAQQRGLLRGIDYSHWAQLVASGLYGPHWLLAYESLTQGWLHYADGADPIGSDPFFSKLRHYGCSFLNFSSDQLGHRIPPAPDLHSNGKEPDMDEDRFDDDDDHDDEVGLFEPESAWEDSYSP